MSTWDLPRRCPACKRNTIWVAIGVGDEWKCDKCHFLQRLVLTGRPSAELSLPKALSSKGDTGFVGVAPYLVTPDLPRIPKKFGLLFDAIAVPNLHYGMGLGRLFKPKRDHLFRELDFLYNNGIIVDPTPTEVVYSRPHEDYIIGCDGGTQLLDEYFDVLNTPERFRNNMRRYFSIGAYEYFMRHTIGHLWPTEKEPPDLKFLRTDLSRLGRLIGRAQVLKYRAAGLESTLICERVTAAFPAVDGCHNSHVTIAVLNAFPEPDETTPWERIFEFRQNPDARHQLFALRRWMRTMARGQANPTEISEELEYLLREYERSLKLHRMIIRKGLLESVLTTSAEALENLCKLRFEKLAKIPFAFRERKLKLLEAEQSAPGREVAYIGTVRASFRQRSATDSAR